MSDPRAEGVRVAYPLFQAEGGGSTPTSALQLRFAACDMTTAKNLNALWHSRLPKFRRPTCRVAYVAEFDGLFWASAIWTNPLSRMLPQTAWLELNRMAIAPDAPKNTASRMLGWMARDVRARFPGVERLVSYQDLDHHTGGIYRAAGWLATHRSVGGDWIGRTGRENRKASQTTAPKQRWEKVLYERTDEAGTNRPEPAGAEAGVPLPGRPGRDPDWRDPLPQPSLWDAPPEDD